MTQDQVVPSNESQDPNPIEQRKEVLKVWAQTLNASQLFLQDMKNMGMPSNRLLTANSHLDSNVPGISEYQAETLIFNTRFRFSPFVIVKCQSSEEVQQAYSCAIKHNLPIRVRSGGHDHEGECSGNDVVLLDLSGLKQFSYCEETKIASIGSGYLFYQLTPLLAEKDRMIAHGTCATVGLAGFIQGGGWGPWTRKYGMCCEHLVGATVILGNGKRVEVDEENYADILWALRGGGAMSYGIVTEFKVKTFELPYEIHRFEISWNQRLPSHADPVKSTPTIKVLTAWEKVINSHNIETRQLLGTNLKINALPVKTIPNEADVVKLNHHSLMYGYWSGTENELRNFIKTYFNVPESQYEIHPAGGRKETDPSKKYDHALLGSWSRNSLFDVLKQQSNTLLNGMPLLQGTPFKPDFDAPAPHKLTSKLVRHEGLSTKGHIALLQSLSSPLLSPDNEGLGLFTYVTLGAITGEYYQQHPKGTSSKGVAFPYQGCQYTIQYQAWWNEAIANKVQQQDNKVFLHTNRAMDWIESSREYKIDGAYGAFISFKDAAIPTDTYFQHHYQDLIEIKEKYTQDSYNHLRTRKTII